MYKPVRGSVRSSCNVSRKARADLAHRQDGGFIGWPTREGYIVLRHHLPIGYRVVNLISCAARHECRPIGTRLSRVPSTVRCSWGDRSPRGIATACKISSSARLQLPVTWRNTTKHGVTENNRKSAIRTVYVSIFRVCVYARKISH